MDEDRPSMTTVQQIQDADARLAARLKQILHTPGISDKDRKLIDGNLRRLAEAQGQRKTGPGPSA